jgi:hypothetical protein
MQKRARLWKSIGEDGRVARVVEPDGSLEEQVAAIRLDASCGSDRL